MKFRIKTDNSNDWEEYNDDDIATLDEAREWAEETLKEYNRVETERYADKAVLRKLIDVEALFDSSLKAIGKRLNTQDNRITQDPIFTVEQLRKDVCPEGYEDGHEWCETESGDYGRATDEEAAELDRIVEMNNFDDVPSKWQCHYYKERWEFVQPFLTEEGAQHHININGHNLTKPRIYVISAQRNLEWQKIRAELMERKPSLGVTVQSVIEVASRWDVDDIDELIEELQYLAE